MHHGGHMGRHRYDEALRARDLGATVPRVLGFLRPYLAPVALILLCLIGAASLIAIPPLLIRELIDVAIPEGNRGLLNVLVLGMVALYVGNHFCTNCCLRPHWRASAGNRTCRMLPSVGL